MEAYVTHKKGSLALAVYRGQNPGEEVRASVCVDDRSCVYDMCLTARASNAPATTAATEPRPTQKIPQTDQNMYI